MAEVRAAIKERDGYVYSDDSVELFVQPHPENELYHQFAVSIAGIQAENRRGADGPEFDWNPEWEVAALKEEGMWSLEMRIPFTVLGGAPKVGDDWRMNFCRNEKPHGEISSWSAVFGSFHDTTRFGKVRFVK